MSGCFFLKHGVCLLATSCKNYSLDLRENVSRNIIEQVCRLDLPESMHVLLCFIFIGFSERELTVVRPSVVCCL